MRLLFLWSLYLHVCFLIVPDPQTEALQLEKCSPDTFSCKSDFGLTGLNCIPKNWVCDGDEDCRDGDDEIDCENPRVCSEDHFQCPVGISRCIAMGWLCDGQQDCDDGSDETPEQCRTHKKGSRTRGEPVDQYRCLPNMYRCPGTFHCINFTQLCDGYQDCPHDGADEGGHCLNRACSRLGSCDYCKETMQGAQCYCDQFKVYNTTQKSCIDINECLYEEYCDQICEDKQNGYNCTCLDGYHHVAPSGDFINNRCYIKTGTPRLIIANHSLIQQLNRTGEVLSSSSAINLDTSTLTTFDFDFRNNSVCWVMYNSPLVCADTDRTSTWWNISMEYSLDYVKQVAKDWVSGNWYFADDVREQIFVCKADGSMCMSVIHTDISRPKSLALDPTKGYMFYTDWSVSSVIGRADLDGSNRQKLVSLKIVHPHGITLDFTRQHLYWGDSYLDFIERIDYNGGHRTTIAYGLNVLNIFSMSLLENDLYLISHQNHSIVKLHRYDLRQNISLVTTPVGNPFIIKVFHAVRQPTLDGNICEARNCSHFCIPVPGTSDAKNAVAKCVCRTGYQLQDETQCVPLHVSPHILYANVQQGMIRSIAVNASIRGDVRKPVNNLVRPVALAVDIRNKNIYYSDINTRKIGRFDPSTEQKIELNLAGNGARTSEGLAIDWMGNNLYWTDNAFMAIFVANLANLSLVRKVVHDNLTHPKSIVLDPENGRMYWTDWVMQPSSRKAKIETSLMDGSQRQVLTNNHTQWPNGLFLDHSSKRLYWTEAYYDCIQSMNLDGTDIRIIVGREHLEHPYGLVVYNDAVYWTEANKGQIRHWNPSSNSSSILRNDSKPLFDMVLITDILMPDNVPNPCKTLHCGDLCLLTGPGSARCSCAMNRKLSDDGQTCTGLIESLHCADKHFMCADDTCVPEIHVCDGLPNCPDGSDETPAACAHYNCSEGMHKCEGTRNCIFRQFVCDGERDCLNGSDESEAICQNHECPASHRKCGNSSLCIPEVWRCDGESDCPDGSDEGGDCSYATCTPEEFNCTTNGRCIPLDYRCDHDYDCEDKSDERGCDFVCDLESQFKCKTDSKCIPKSLVCDGVQNCTDGSDEFGCLSVMCRDTEFKCHSNLSCIPKAAVCDFIKDCSDGSDESGCTVSGMTPLNNGSQCHWSEFMCEDRSRCIPNVWQCDRDVDCTDRSDEMHCSSECEAPGFRCKAGNSSMCLPPEKLCNSIQDCHDGSDEGRLCLYDLCLNNDCSDKCHNGPDGYVCSCFENRQLSKDNRTCTDIHVCTRWGICSQNCTATVEVADEGKKCSCFPGYELESDKWTCKATSEEPPMVIFSRRHEIRQLNLRDMKAISLVSGLRNTIAVDFLWENKYLFWTDVGDDKIYRGTIMSNTVTDIQRIVDVGLATTEGVAVDWVGGNIYWVESNLDQIEVAKLNGSLRTTLLAGSMHSPRAIVLDPRVGFLFWTDWDGENPRIERCSMSGENNTRRIVYNITSLPSGGWPNGLTLDYEAYRLYWVDARSDSVHTVDYDGKSHRLVLVSHDHLSHPFSLTLFEHNIYWTDWRQNTLVRANKFDGSNITVISRTYTQPFDVKIFHPLRQPPVTNNPCAPETNGGCSHLCLLGHQENPDGSFQLLARCRCPHRWKLNLDNKTCIQDNTFLLYVKENEIRGVDLQTAHYNVIPSITVPFVENASAIDYDVTSDRLYWTDSKKQVITSAFLNGTGVQTIIDTGLSNPEGLAIDWLSRNMYFTSYDEEKATISVANLDGAYRTEIVRLEKGEKNELKLNSIAIHPKKGLMFWSNTGGGSNHTIMRAYMDGSSPTTFVTDAMNAASLTLDLDEDVLYWVSRTKSPKVYFCQLTDSADLCKATPKVWQGVTDPFSLTIYHRTAYFSSSDKIVKVDMNKNGQMIEELRLNTPRVSALAVYDPSLRNGSNSCSKKNGDCQQLCLPLKTSRKCRCTSGFKLNSDQKTCSGVRSFLLYSTSTEIRGLSLENWMLSTKKDMEALAPVSKITLASSVDFYAKNDQIYWVDTTARTISRINRDLSSRETIVNDGISGVENVAVDWIAGNIYWTDRGHDVIQVSKLNGSNRFVVIHEGLEKPHSIALHPTKGYLFYSDWGSVPKISRARLDGSEREDIVTQHSDYVLTDRTDLLLNSSSKSISAPYGLAIDYEEDVLYWCDKNLDIIERVNISTGERKVIVSNREKALLVDCVSMDVFGEHIYWADLTDHGGSIKRANKIDGSGVVVLKENISKLQDIKIFNPDKQNGTNRCAQNNGGCAELCLYRGNGDITCACSHGKLAEDSKSCEEYKSFLLYSKVTSIESIPLGGNKTNLNSPKQPIKPPTNQHEIMQNVIGLAFDYDNQRLFFSDIQKGDIYSVSLNGTDFKSLFPNVGSAEGLAYDGRNKHLYFTSYTNSSINRINFNPQSTHDFKDQPTREILVQLDPADHPRAIVVNPCLQQIFWTNWNPSQPSIQRSTTEGQKAESIVTHEIRTPNGLAIDFAARKLYWSDARLDKIERINYDGTDRIVIVASITQHSFSLAVHGDYLYWTDWLLRAVLRANKYDGSEIQLLRKDIDRQPMGILVVDEENSKCEADPCYKNAFGCDQLCSVNISGKPECGCREGYRLLEDGKMCFNKSATTSCQATDFVCADRNQCIPFEKSCDRIIHCRDASDENLEYCSNRRCPAQMFECVTGWPTAFGFIYQKMCLNQSRVCDGVSDCTIDFSDEKDCPCLKNEFRCVSDGMCINEALRCDQDKDCADFSDEINCNVNCSAHEIDGVRLEQLIPCETTSLCIYSSWVCDQSNDCWDNSDEKNCNYTDICPTGMFRCDDNSCILERWRCDKERDCKDGSDETNCSYICESDQLECDGGKFCIPETWKCDGYADCRDGSDEDNCTSGSVCNSATHFQCSNGRCIQRAWLCDGEADCIDAGDEKNSSGCGSTIQEFCAWNQFHCLNGHCIQSFMFCDGDNDCGDNSDEPDTCAIETCRANEFQCTDMHRCISNQLRCNGYIDCPDHSDEANCSPDVPPCGNNFQCRSGMCISKNLTCNYYPDCPDGSDEPPNCGKNECHENNGNCSHICIDEVIGYRCSCPRGYIYNDTNKTCMDVDECTSVFPCSQHCTNYVGTYRCKCAEGYTLEIDRHSCKSNKTPWPVLLVANRYFIRLVNITSGLSTEVKSSCTNAVAVDFDWREQYVYWSDITFTSSSINRKRLNDSNASVEVLHSTTVRNPDGLAVDWVGRNLYWCDKTTDTIEVSRLDGSNRLVLLREGLQEPRGLEVYPQKALLFYTDWGDSPHIGSMGMDGSNPRVLIQDHLAWPNALTIDYVTGTLFWADGNLDYIAMVGIDGNGRRTVIGTGTLVPHVFAITTFENRLYWTDWEKDAIMYADKFSGNNTRNLTTLAHRPMDIQVLHPLRQEQVKDASGRDPCEHLGCTHLCLLKRLTRLPNYESVIGVCACPENFYLAHDGISCISNCTMSQFKCAYESKCIPKWWECDNRQDCIDGSDEHKDCEPYHCQVPGMFQCKEKSETPKCIFPYQICDGKLDCTDGSDEEKCEFYHCLEHYFKCDKKCIPEMKKCDGHSDCSDNVDETACVNQTCSNSQFRCANSRCVPYVWRCDGDNDCGDNSDELAGCNNMSCQTGHFKCKESGRCIPEGWKCDGDRDCGETDDSDESQDECKSKTCDPTYFKCKNGHCIPGRWKCDFYDDCKDHSDEDDCAPQNCSTGDFKCTNGRCIPHKNHCDGNDDCGDHSDEIACNVNCSSMEFMCKNNHHCVPLSWRCDGDSDCSDNSDEWGCDRTCNSGEFQCNNSICQPLLWRCDRDNDCGDGSDEDEHMCAQYSCAPGRFRCNDHVCIWNSMVCDGSRDCKGGEDESRSLCPDMCPTDRFRCQYSNLCLPMLRVCDGNLDCLVANKTDKSDEDPAFCTLVHGASCGSNVTNNCQHHCRQHGNGTRCSCKLGYKLADDGFSCHEVDPCTLLETCPQKCSFDRTSLQLNCSCNEGFEFKGFEIGIFGNDKEASLERKGGECRLKVNSVDDWPVLLIGGEGEVAAWRMLTNQSMFLQGASVKVSAISSEINKNDINKKQHIIDMALDVAQNQAFVLSETNHTWRINRISLDKLLAAASPSKQSNTRKRRESSVMTQIHQSPKEIRSLSVDWISKRLYFVEGTSREVRVMDYQGEKNKLLVYHDMGSPQAVAVDSVNGKLYWSDRSKVPSISQANLDGSESKVVVVKGLAWPYDIVVDGAAKRLFWVDRKMFTLETATTEGYDRRILHKFDGPPTSLELFGDVLYILQGGKIYYLTRYRPQHVNILFETDQVPRVVLVSQKFKQPTEGPRACQDKPKSCEETQLCFNLPNGTNVSCLCPDNSYLEDKKCQFVQCGCLNGGTCSGGVKNKCICPKGFDGEFCENYKCTDYCRNGGTCNIMSTGEPKCLCLPTYTGKRCTNITLQNSLNVCNNQTCYNGGTCKMDMMAGYEFCHCLPGYTGARCEHCLDLECYNGGHCMRRGWFKTCVCPDGFDPQSNCAENCESLCRLHHQSPMIASILMSHPTECDCLCPPSFMKHDCPYLCRDHCKIKSAVCSLNENRKPQCQCNSKFHDGERCEKCLCHPGGECQFDGSNNANGCKCSANYTGAFCESLVTSSSGMSMGSETLILGASLAAVIFLVAIAVTIVCLKRKRRQEQYNHKRMADNGELNVTNPVYMRKDPGDEEDEDDDEEALGAGLIYTGDASTNFANPMYDVYNQRQSESTQMLLGTPKTREENEELLDDKVPVRYFGSNQGPDSHSFSTA